MSEVTITKKTIFPVLFRAIALVVFIIAAFRSYLVPFNHDETATFFFFIQSGHYMPFHSAVDANNHVLNSFLGNICFHLFGSSPFALRLPNLMGLIVLMLATYKISKNLNQLGSKLLLTGALLLSFHWLTFFSACRGYGLSLALLIMGIACMLDFMKVPASKSKFLLSLLFFQLAISSNLILIIVVLLLSGIILLIQIFNKTLFKPLVLVTWLAHLAAVYYWLSFSFFLQDNGALYYGEGDSYWQVTFATLLQLVIGSYAAWMKWAVLSSVAALGIGCLYINRHHVLKIKTHLRQPDLSVLFFVIFFSLVLGFYLMHVLFGVNFPEDRTGLFFYVFFMLLLCFTIDKLSMNINRVIGIGLTSLFLIHFMVNLNFRKHSLNVYETIPEHFYTTLLKEQEKSPERITIGGHRVRELFYGFFNYRYGGVLNPADPTEVMQMNCDYYIATKPEEKYFKPYYDIIGTEPDWGFVLLKRKEKIVRHKILEINHVSLSHNENEFIELYAHGDTTFANTNPLIAEIDLAIEKIPVPVNAWVVLQVNDSLDQTLYFKRYPLQWLGYDLNGRKNLLCTITIGNLPKRAKKIAYFIWNIEKQPLSLTVNSLKISQLDGKGVNYEAPDIK
ncbi:MAG: hypothetical protein V4580_06960 [Bacteroidota bacterium]